MEMILGYLVICFIVFVTSTLSLKVDNGYVTVGNLIFLLVFSIIPAINIVILLASIGFLLFSKPTRKFLEKKIL